MKAFCAVAPIPRPEDFGLADAVATLLRPEGKFWYAEDSFLVQFKSRTEKSMMLTDTVFTRWLAQDLSVFLARVNLLKDTIELFTLGTAQFDSRLHNAKGLAVWLKNGEDGLRDGVLHLMLEQPILKWAVADTEDADFIERTYATLKQWLNLERWNRRYFRAGVARAIEWQTNEMPAMGEVVHTWTPAHGREALADIEPLVHLLGLHARQHPELWTRVHAVEEALRGPDDPGISTKMQSIFRLHDAMSRLGEIVKKHPVADVAMTVQILHCDMEGANLLIHSHDRDGKGGSQRYEGTWEELRQKGFDSEILGEGPNTKTILSLTRYFATRPIPLEIVEGPEGTPNLDQGDHSPCIFLRRIHNSNPLCDA